MSLSNTSNPSFYAIIQSGGFQHRVVAGQHLKVAKIDKDPGHQFQITEILAIGGDNPLIGDPFVKDAMVEAEVKRHARHNKILVLKKQRRKRHRRIKGHRQDFTELKIHKIITPSLGNA